MSLRLAVLASLASLLVIGAAIQACGGDDDTEITGQNDDGGSDSPSFSDSTSPGTDGGGGGLDAIADSPQATPLCNVDGGFGCVVPEKCDPALGCVACAGNNDCAALADKFCVRGDCVQCSTGADCPGSGTACYPRDHTCKTNCDDAGGNCNGARASICDTATGACVGCQSATDCADSRNKQCDPITKQCVECTTSAECTGTNKFCHPTLLSCVECLTHGACPAADGGAPQVCDPVDFRCRGGCFTNKDCGGSTPTCNLTTLRCGCSTNPDCANNPAAKFCSTTANVCVECLVAGDCNKDAGFLQCSNNRCVGCLSNPDCAGFAGTTLCNTTTQKCVECLGDGDCTQNPRRTCTNGACVK